MPKKVHDNRAKGDTQAEAVDVPQVQATQADLDRWMQGKILDAQLRVSTSPTAAVTRLCRIASENDVQVMAPYSAAG